MMTSIRCETGVKSTSVCQAGGAKVSRCREQNTSDLGAKVETNHRVAFLKKRPDCPKGFDADKD